MARHVGRLKLGSKPTQLNGRLSIIPPSQQANYGNYKTLSSSFRLFTFIPYRICIYIYIYSRGVWNALFFIGCYWMTDVYKNGRSPALLFFCFWVCFFCFFCFGRGMSVPRRDQGGGLALPESCRGFCRSRYDIYNPKSAMKIVHHWRPTLIHLGCLIEIYIYMCVCVCGWVGVWL